MASLQVLLFLCIIVTVSRAGRLQKRIYGGIDCPNTDRLYHVKILTSDGVKNFKCGGSLISDSWILSAAHCWDPSKKKTMDVILGVHPGPGRTVRIQNNKIFRYEDKNNNNKIHDIMLLKLPSSTTFPHIALPDCNNQPKVNDPVQVAGYGNCKLDQNLNEVPSSPQRLQCAVMDVTDCISGPDCSPNERVENWLCAKRRDPPQGEHCGGDSGGGVVHNGKIYAVVSAADICHDSSFRSYFLKVCPYMKWISKTMAKNR